MCVCDAHRRDFQRTDDPMKCNCEWISYKLHTSIMTFTRSALHRIWAKFGLKQLENRLKVNAVINHKTHWAGQFKLTPLTCYIGGSNAEAPTLSDERLPSPPGDHHRG